MAAVRRTAALLAFLALAACGREEAQPPPAEAPAAPAPAAGPLTFEQKTDAATVTLELPERVGQFPALHARLYAPTRDQLLAFAETAARDMEDMRAAGFPLRPYELGIEYRMAAETPRLVSLRVRRFENTGGAHPNTTLDALTWEKAANRPVAMTDLFAPDADMTGADRALCEAIRAAKRERTGQAELSGEFTACPALRSVRATLVPSTVTGKAGGLAVLFSPYEIGPYVEGAYEVVVPFAAIRSALSPDFAAEFDGAPAPGAPAG